MNDDDNFFIIHLFIIVLCTIQQSPQLFLSSCCCCVVKLIIYNNNKEERRITNCVVLVKALRAPSTHHSRHVSSGFSIDEMFRIACAIVAFILMPGTLGVAVRGKDRHVRAVASSPLRGSHRPKDDTAKHKIEQFIRITSFIQRANGAIDTKNQRKKSFNLLRKLVRSPPVTQPSAPATESQNNHRFIEKRSEAEVQQSAAAAASQRMAVQQAQEAKQGLFLGSGVRAPPGAMQLINTPDGRRMGFSPGFLAGAHRFASPGVHLQIPGVATRTFAGHQVDAVLPPTSPPPPAMIDSPPLPQEAYRQAAYG